MTKQAFPTENDILIMTSELIYQENIMNFIEWIDLELDISLDIGVCINMHEIWFNKMMKVLTNNNLA